MSLTKPLTRWQKTANWLHLKDPILVTKVNDKFYIHLHTRLALLAVLFSLAGIFFLGAGMMSVVIKVTPAMIQTNRALNSCMDFEDRIRHSFDTKIENATMEVENLRSVNMQLIRQLEVAPVGPQNVAKGNIPAPKYNVGGYP